MFAIINATVEPVTSPRINHGTVIVKNGKIASVGTNIKLPKDIQIIDARGSLLTPGLMDAHSHAGLWEDGSVNDGDVNEKSHPVTPQLRALDAFRPSDPALIEAAQSGVTSIFVTPGSTNVFCGLGAVVKTAAKDFNSQIVKPDAGLKMATGENPKRAYGSKMMPFSRMGTAAIMRSTFTKASIYAQKKYGRKKRKMSCLRLIAILMQSAV
jgi:imidazolonepropionase-like amidohydrolase